MTWLVDQRLGRKQGRVGKRHVNEHMRVSTGSEDHCIAYQRPPGSTHFIRTENLDIVMRTSHCHEPSTLLSSHHDRSGECCLGSTARDFTHQNWAGYCPCWMSNLPAKDTKAGHPAWHHPSKGITSYLMVSWSHWILSTVEGTATYLDWNQHTFWLWAHLSLLLGFGWHHYAKAYRVCDPSTLGPV